MSWALPDPTHHRKTGFSGHLKKYFFLDAYQKGLKYNDFDKSQFCKKNKLFYLLIYALTV